MSLEELKARAARKNQEREEETAKSLQERERQIEEHNKSQQKAKEEESRLKVNWTVDLRTGSQVELLISSLPILQHHRHAIERQEE